MILLDSSTKGDQSRSQNSMASLEGLMSSEPNLDMPEELKEEIRSNPDIIKKKAPAN